MESSEFHEWIYDCGHDGAQLVMDPFIEEVYGEQVWRRMCDECYMDRKDEV